MQERFIFMTYSVLRRGNQYDIVDDSNMFIDEWAGKKSEAEVKDHNLNSASSTMDDVVNAGNGEEKNDRTARALSFYDFQSTKR